MLLVLDPGVSSGEVRDEAAATGTPLKVVECEGPALRALHDAPLTLIRPDQNVAWRGDAWPVGGDLLLRVTGRR